MAHLAIHGVLPTALSKHHWHVPASGLIAFAIGTMCAVMFALVHFYGAALLTFLLGVVVSRACSNCRF